MLFFSRCEKVLYLHLDTWCGVSHMPRNPMCSVAERSYQKPTREMQLADTGKKLHPIPTVIKRQNSDFKLHKLTQWLSKRRIVVDKLVITEWALYIWGGNEKLLFS